MPGRNAKRDDATNAWEPEAWKQAVAFGEALRRARLAAGLTQVDLEASGIVDGQSTWSGWENPHPARPRSKPLTPEKVFEIEKFLGVAPGSLSKHFGYLPASVVKVACTFEQAIASDPNLTKTQKANLRALYREFTRS